MLAYKVYLGLFILLAGHEQPFQEAAEVPSIEVCLEQQRKLLSQPLPRNVMRLQASCILVAEGERA